LNPVLQRALAAHQAGRTAEAEALYRQALALEPGNGLAQHSLGLLRYQQGRLDEALSLMERARGQLAPHAGMLSHYALVLLAAGRADEALAQLNRALMLDRNCLDALNNRGAVLARMGRWAEAAADFERVLKIDPRAMDALVNRAGALRMLGRAREALQAYDRALALQPRNPALLTARGGLLNELGRPDEALNSLERAIGLGGADAERLHQLGLVLTRLGRPQDALQVLDQAVAMAPGYAPAHVGRGLALRALGRPMEALAALDEAVRLQPDWAEPWNDRALVLHWDLRRSEAALASFDRCLVLSPDFAAALANKGALLWQMDRIDAASAYLDRALALDPDLPAALHNRADMTWARRRLFEPARRDLDRLLKINPDYPFARGALMHVKGHVCDWAGYDLALGDIDKAVRAGKLAIEPFAYQGLSASPADMQACARLYAAARHPARPAAPIARRPADGKIRLGYVCGEFREQATAHLAAGLFERHDRDRFEVIAFDNGRSDGSAMRARLEAAFDRMVPIRALDDAAAAEQVRQAGVAVLINLNGYFGALRADLFARRPAPVQVNFLGFPGTLGAPYIDYIVADRIVIPQGEQGFYDEKIAWLPDCYQVNDDRRPLPAPDTDRAAHGLPEGQVVFCHFNAPYKINPEVFGAWMRILQGVDGAVLWLLQGVAPCGDNLRREAAARGVDPGRLIFAPALPHQAHLARQPLADLFLDSWPSNAHTTASDALWMGLPLITRLGSAFSGRVAASLLQAAGLSDLIAGDRQAYEDMAIGLGRDPARLAGLRQRVTAARDHAPLFDTGLYARRIEAAYTTMAALWREGRPPASFTVP
jgi:predicted O-linked N-acetylglucosamine transferase (SPINDLY family)